MRGFVSQLFSWLAQRLATECGLCNRSPILQPPSNDHWPACCFVHCTACLPCGGQGFDLGTHEDTSAQKNTPMRFKQTGRKEFVVSTVNVPDQLELGPNTFLRRLANTRTPSVASLLTLPPTFVGPEASACCHSLTKALSPELCGAPVRFDKLGSLAIVTGQKPRVDREQN